MKSKRILLIFVCIVAALSFTGCKPQIEKYAENISELRDNVYEGGNETMTVTAITGRREDPYILDGHCTGAQDFTLIKIVPKEFIAGKVYSYSVKIGDKEFTGEMKQHPFGKSFSADIAARSYENEIAVSVTADAQTETFTLVSVVTEDMIKADKALEIASARLKKEISSLSSGGRLCAEIYIRLMPNPIDNSGSYHWYVAYIGEAQLTYAALIEPHSMEIVAVRD